MAFSSIFTYIKSKNLIQSAVVTIAKLQHSNKIRKSLLIIYHLKQQKYNK